MEEVDGVRVCVLFLLAWMWVAACFSAFCFGNYVVYLHFLSWLPPSKETQVELVQGNLHMS